MDGFVPSELTNFFTNEMRGDETNHIPLTDFRPKRSTDAEVSNPPLSDEQGELDDIFEKQVEKLTGNTTTNRIQWSPSESPKLVLVANNNLYFLKDYLQPKDYKKITDNGEKGVIFNGIADYLYEGKKF